MSTRHFSACALALALAAITAAAQEQTAPVFTASGELQLPSDYREWVFVGAGLGMSYGPSKRPADRPAAFENIYVPRATYRAFMESGKWPERTILVMEGRASETHELLANTGQTQGAATYVEAIVKDSSRFPETTWAFFNFGNVKTAASSARQLPVSMACYSCHRDNTAVEHTFVQYDPALYEAAKKFGTVKPTFDPARKF